MKTISSTAHFDRTTPRSAGASSARLSCLAALAFFLTLSAHAQWQTQTNVLKPGWTAVYLHVDPSYTNLDTLVAADLSNPISEIWLWMPSPLTMQFVTGPQSPIAASSQWASWQRVTAGNNSLTTLIPNAAYLVHSTATTNYTWRLKGRPTPPNYSWASAGLNFIGFPTPAVNPPMFDSFLSLAPGLQSTAEIYRYVGGNLNSTNPVQLFTFHTTPVTRGQAFWMRGPVHNDYFGPFNVTLQAAAGADYGDSVSQYSFTLRNTTDTNVTVSLRLLSSEAPPAYQNPILAAPPLLVRGALNLTNLTYGYSNLMLGVPQSWVLAPQGKLGSEVSVVLGLNRFSMTTSPGVLYAGILQFSDSFGFSEIDVPVSARTAPTAGLWVGDASVTQVASYLKSYQVDENNVPVISSNGNYIITSINTNLNATAAPYPLRLIVHYDGTNAVLLQRVYYGLDKYTNHILATQESLLDPANLDSARRLSSAHLPWTTTNHVWTFTGQLIQGGTLTVATDLPYDDQASNPFLHTYHPDHDNLDVTFSTQLAQGYESYTVHRQLTLNVNQPAGDFAALTSVGQSLSGSYQETVTIQGLAGASRTFNVSGFFALNRLSSIPTLTTH